MRDSEDRQVIGYANDHAVSPDGSVSAARVHPRPYRGSRCLELLRSSEWRIRICVQTKVAPFEAECIRHPTNVIEGAVVLSWSGREGALYSMEKPH